mgnify:FL=1
MAVRYGAGLGGGCSNPHWSGWDDAPFLPGWSGIRCWLEGEAERRSAQGTKA